MGLGTGQGDLRRALVEWLSQVGWEEGLGVGKMRKHCPAGRRQAWTTEPCGIFSAVSNQLSGGSERPPGAAGSEGEPGTWSGAGRAGGQVGASH